MWCDVKLGFLCKNFEKEKLSEILFPSVSVRWIGDFMSIKLNWTFYFTFIRDGSNQYDQFINNKDKTITSQFKDKNY